MHLTATGVHPIRLVPALLFAFSPVALAAEDLGPADVIEPAASLAAPTTAEANPATALAPATPATIVISRASDLIGQPVDLVKYSSLALNRNGEGAKGGIPDLSPVSFSRVSSKFGSRYHPILRTVRAHNGIDLAAPTGTAIRATRTGVVTKADWNGGYGLLVSLKHGGGVETEYGHMSRLAVKAGQTVQRGQVIGYVGSTGLSTGPHLHYEVRVNGRAVDPSKAIR